MEIYLIRHTTPAIAKGICYGQSDLEVSDSFDQEVRTIHEQIPIHTIDEVYSSPLKRCSLLAETFAKPVTYDDRLKELDFGSWELQPWSAIDPEEMNPWMNDFVHQKVPNGESYIMLQKRVMETFLMILQKSIGNVAIVTHAAPMRVIVSHILKKTLSTSFDIKINYGHVYKIKYSGTGFEINEGLEQ